jgi:hypothetical protein
MKAVYISCSLALLFASCSSSIQPEELYGRWNYTKVYNADPRDSLPAGELELQAPAIIFSKDNKLVIEWGGKPLSQGKFKMEGKMIRYTEDLGSNKTRDFPFLIKSIDNEELVFETMEKNFTRVTAKKE